MDLKDFVGKLERDFEKHEEAPYQILLSMELFCSSKLENNDKSKLIMLVSALETLVVQRNLETEIGNIVEKLLEVAEESDIEDSGLKASIIGQVKNLTRESIRRALKRLLKENEFKPEEISFVEEAYTARSAIVHDGKRVPELSKMNSELETILVRIYKRL